jgi:tetratricopeptide (TPR) repeat protein
MLGPLSCVASDNLAKATLLYGKGQYIESLQFIEAELKANPKNAAAHYLFGNVLMNTKAFPEAIREYQSAAALDPTSPSGIYSKQELTRLGVASKSAVPCTPQATPQGQPAPPAAPQALKQGDKEEQALKHAVSATSRETTEQSKAIEEECDRKLVEINRVLEDKIKALEEEMRGRIAENGTYQNYGYGKYYDPEPINAPIREDYKGRIKTLQDAADRRCENVKASYKQRLVLIEQAGLNADKSFLEADPAKTIKLRPKGSDLHVHNYESSDEATGQTVPLLAEPGKLGVVAKKGKTSIIDADNKAQKMGK